MKASGVFIMGVSLLRASTAFGFMNRRRLITKVSSFFVSRKMGASYNHVSRFLSFFFLVAGDGCALQFPNCVTIPVTIAIPLEFPIQ